MNYRYEYVLADDGDYIVWESFCWNGMQGGFWKEHTRWLIPNTQIED